MLMVIENDVQSIIIDNEKVAKPENYVDEDKASEKPSPIAKNEAKCKKGT